MQRLYCYQREFENIYFYFAHKRARYHNRSLPNEPNVQTLQFVVAYTDMEANFVLFFLNFSLDCGVVCYAGDEQKQFIFGI